MTRKIRVCIDCGEQFKPRNQMDNDDNEQDPSSAIAVCERCVVLQKKRFWNSMKMEMKKSSSNNVSIQEEQSKK